MATGSLSEKVRDLIRKARIVSFETWHETYPTEIIQYFQAADDQRRYLTDEDLQHIVRLAPATADSIVVVQYLRDHVSPIVEEARSGVLETFPGITEPGGSLYPPERADACWRDFWHFLRCIVYGIAGQRTDYTSADGLHYMQLLYQELKVPLDAMLVGLEGVKQASLSRLKLQSPDLAPYFDHLIIQLQQFC
ncbi:MAG: phycobilisome protein [Leptolyngbya sp. SIO1D8]|nr:phycobilisome protein [Leptolyngbya sp. SIO1D8]